MVNTPVSDGRSGTTLTSSAKCESERESISQSKSKTTEAVANRGVDADAPRGENEDQKKGRMKNFEMRKIREKWNAIYNT